jgi:hydroxymethylglutaryl-CoA reductase (NADPH)
MPQSLNQSRLILDQIIREHKPEDILSKLKPRPTDEYPLPKRVPSCLDFTEYGLSKRRAYLKEQGISCQALSGEQPDYSPESLKGNIENLIGYARIPVGVIGPLRINGLNANGDFFVPMATTEGSLLASYKRGAHIISQSGGASAMCLTESVSRAPCFIFNNLTETSAFMNWFLNVADSFKEVVKRTTRHGKLIDIKTTLCGSLVYLIFEYTTGDASGQNMVTVATDEICREIIERSPIKPARWYLEGNLSGDKKASMLSFLGTRGKKIITEVILPEDIVRKFLHTTPGEMARYGRISSIGAVQSGSIGVQGHFANALAALFIACGQDVACVSESSIGITDMYVTDEGSLHTSVSMPNLIVGTIGGGTHLPTANECLQMMDCYGSGGAKKFAEICAVTAMAGEISIIGSLAAGDFGKAHATFRHKD